MGWNGMMRHGEAASEKEKWKIGNERRKIKQNKK